MNSYSRELNLGIRAASLTQGCLLGQLAGNALGSLVEFQSPEEIQRSYPDGVRELADGGTWNTIVGPPTDDSKMAMLLARMLVEHGTYVPEAAKAPPMDYIQQQGWVLIAFRNALWQLCSIRQILRKVSAHFLHPRRISFSSA